MTQDGSWFQPERDATRVARSNPGAKQVLTGPSAAICGTWLRRNSLEWNGHTASQHLALQA